MGTGINVPPFFCKVLNTSGDSGNPDSLALKQQILVILLFIIIA